jgi:STE24 endopeptidase
MPFSLLIAIFLAFGFDLRGSVGPMAPAELQNRLFETLTGVGCVGLMAFLLGQWVAFRVARNGGPSGAIRRSFAVGSRALDITNLVVYAWIIHGIDWPSAVESGMGFRDTILIDEFLILLPFLLAQILTWLGLYAGERALRSDAMKPGRRRYMILRARQSLGLVLPVAFVFSLGQDLLRRAWPQSVENPWVEMGWMAVMGTLVLVLSPAFVRLTWPTYPLPPGPLRDRLERLARRFRFRCSDILVWDTGNALVNAGVTGALPWYRYVLLTDALVDHLDPHQIEAVFGHEVGHIAHRHLLFFGFFFMGSISMMALVRKGIESFLGWSPWAQQWLASIGAEHSTMLAVELVTVLLALGIYFLIVFGFLSRRFERQADVFGCRAVSCGRPDCPPHADINGLPTDEPQPRQLCTVGIRIFASALSEVASLNGMERESLWAWRHGSISRRIAFLEALEGKPEAERRFQRDVGRLRLGLAVVLASAMVIAIRIGALEKLL